MKHHHKKSSKNNITKDLTLHLSRVCSTMAVFSFCKMVGEQSIALLASKFEGQGVRIAHKFLTCFTAVKYQAWGVKQALNDKHGQQDRYLCKKTLQNKYNST